MNIPPPQRDFAPNLQACHRSAGAAATKKALEDRPAVDWSVACKRVREMLKRMYADGAMDGPELRHETSRRREGATQ